MAKENQVTGTGIYLEWDSVVHHDQSRFTSLGLPLPTIKCELQSVYLVLTLALFQQLLLMEIGLKIVAANCPV